MSAYYGRYTACHGEGLVLTPGELEQFLENYQKKHKRNTKLTKQIEEFSEGEIDIKEIVFQNKQGDPFSISYVGEDNAEGFRLIPYRIENEPNTDWNENTAIPSSDVYVVPADKPVNGMSCFEKKPYASYEEFVKEFTDKMGGCLPKDFDWHSHIGIYSYAALI